MKLGLSEWTNGGVNFQFWPSQRGRLFYDDTYLSCNNSGLLRIEKAHLIRQATRLILEVTIISRVRYPAVLSLFYTESLLSNDCFTYTKQTAATYFVIVSTVIYGNV